MRKRSLLCVLIVYILLFMFYFCWFIDIIYVDFCVVYGEMEIYMCKVVYVDWIKGYEVVYECIYYWNIIVFVKVILLFVVVMLDFLMVRKFFCVDNKW